MGDARPTLTGLFAEGAVRGGGGGLLVERPGGIRLSYDDAERRVARLAGALDDAGVRPGDRVASLVAKSPESMLFYLATLRRGAVYLPMNPAYTDDEVAHVLADAEPALVVADPARRLDPGPVEVRTLDGYGRGSLAAGDGDAEFRPATVGPDDPAVLLYTSGTTGRPKGALLSHGNLASNAATLRDAWGFGPGDRLLHALPIYHAHGLLVAINVTLATGSSLRWLDRFSVDSVLEALPEVTVFMGVPTFYRRLLADERLDRERCRGVRLFVSGSAPLPAGVHQDWERRTGHRILERYGMTETVMLCSNPLHGERRPGTVGPPLAGVDVRIVDPESGEAAGAGVVGAIEVRGPNVFAGYWRRPRSDADFAPGGWFRTGDLGSFDADGYLTIVGRAKDLVITGGLNVYPKEVEDALDAARGGRRERGGRRARPRSGGNGGGRGRARRRPGRRPRSAAPSRARPARRLQGPQAGDLRRPPAAQRHGQGGEGRAQEAPRPRVVGVIAVAEGAGPARSPRTEPVVPDYRGPGIASVVPALLAPPGRRPDWLPAPARLAPQVVLLVLDGLGWNQLGARPDLAPTLTAMAGGPITSVAPTTTATALSSIVTGTPPSVHGIVGYRVRVAGPSGEEVLNVLRWRTARSDARTFVPPESFGRAPAFLGQPVPVVSREGFSGSGFTLAHQGASPERSYTLVSGMAVEVRAALLSGERFVYAYYEGVDKIAHARGFGPHYDAEVAAADRLAAEVGAALPPGAVLVVTADHGQVHVGDAMRTLGPDVVDAARLASGEARFVWLHAKDGRRDELLAAAERSCGSEAWVATAEDLIGAGWFGGPLDPSLRARYGDVAVVAHRPVGYRHPRESTDGRLVCRHGSLTADEMLVPLLARRG